MDWILRSPQIHSTFGSLGHVQADRYHVNENCDAALQTILQSILTEDEYLRPYRRSIFFAKTIEKDLIPLLVNVKEDRTLELLIRILVNLTIPIECLLSVDGVNSQTIFEINNLLTSIKTAFTDVKATSAVVDFLKKNLGREEGGKLSVEQCANISNGLLLLRNILHITEEPNSVGSDPYPNSSNFKTTPHHSMQNRIMWNIFSQSIDKVLIKLMIIPEASNWAVTMVQLIALLYKDQHVSTLHKLLNTWLDASVSESSEDNESNTSNTGRVSQNSSFMVTSDSTLDSSDTGSGNDDGGDGTGPQNIVWDGSNNAEGSNNAREFKSKPKNDRKPSSEKRDDAHCDPANTDSANNETSIGFSKGQSDRRAGKHSDVKNKKITVVSENSDFGYGTQIETRESISTSSNDDEYPLKKPVHQKPLHLKQKANHKNWPVDATIHDKKRKKLVKRGKSNMYSIPVQELQDKTPSDDDISNILKEFTVDFLLKGYNSLVETLYNQILLNTTLEIDTSHFFWLVTYFLKFATQIELDLEHISSVLSFEIVTYLTAEGVNLCEQFELAIKLDQNGVTPILKKLHLVVTAIREFIQAIEAYEKFPDICNKSKDYLKKITNKVIQTAELRNLFVLLLQYYKKNYHTKQYLVDLIVTNHILLSFLDRVTKTSDEKGAQLMVDHMKQFAATEIMQQYGILLEDYLDNGEFVNDCVFTLMHHVGGELESLITLFQPKILTTFTSIWKSEFYVCDDWADLIEYVINTFIKKPQTLQNISHIRLESQCLDNFKDKPTMETDECDDFVSGGGAAGGNKDTTTDSDCDSDQGRWTEKEILSLTWNYMQSSNYLDVVSEVTEQLKENGICKTRMAVVSELYRQNLINQEQYKDFTRGENLNKPKKVPMTKEMRDDEIRRLCELLRQDGKSKCLDWLQDVLLELCFAKICFEKRATSAELVARYNYKQMKRNDSEFKEHLNDLPVMSSVAWLALLNNQPVALVPWNCEQSAICQDLRFLQLIHKFGFCVPVDTEKVFIRIPNNWTTGFLFDIARRLSPVDMTKLKFSIDDISGSADLASQTAHDSHNNNQTSLENDHIRGPELTTMLRNSPQTGIADSMSWLDIVKKSQNAKLFDLGSGPSVEQDVDMNVEMPIPEQPEPAACSLGVRVRSDALSGSAHSTYPDIPDDADADDGADTDCSNSIYDTVSIASDLTCMYVSDTSDEDEPPEMSSARMRDSLHDPPFEDTATISAEKRPHNVQFAIPHIGKKMRANSHLS